LTRPARIIELRDEEAGLQAFIVIDHELFPVAAGGTRMLPDVSVDEVARLARAMTWKFSACRVPYAGAKAGLRFADGDRDSVIAAYLRALEPLQDFFLTGPDMGTRPSDFAGQVEGDELPLWALDFEGLGMDDLATGHGVKAAAEAGLRHLDRSLAGATIAIEGFGKVGAGTARACARAGARIIAVSTIHGLAVDPGGLDVEDLIRLRVEHGDRLVEHAGSSSRPREELFDLDCDVLVPGARPDSITAAVVERLRCRIVAPGANVPYGAGAIEALHARGILAIPDFVANSGGVHLYESVRQDDQPAAALGRIEELVGAAVTRLLEAAAEANSTPMAAAIEEARVYLREETGAPSERLDELFGQAAAPF
jgi:glutamate dehydrogenase (NAD(P)+)